MGKKSDINKEEFAESWCFKCKDGGLLRVCDFKNCLKAYHPECVEKEEDFVTSEAPWSCGWHFCFICENTPKFQCFCCPNAVCGHCLSDAQFVVIKGMNGFCIHCATLAGLLEGVKNPDPNEERVDFNAEDTYEAMFKSYWEMTKKKQNLKAQHVRDAMKLFSKDINYNKDFGYCGIDEVLNSLSSSEDKGGDFYNPESDQATDVCKRNKRKHCRQRNIKPRKKDLVGWGSQPLMGFLATIGKDTSQELSQQDVTDMILRYCKEKCLFHPEKKKKVICDLRLQSLLRRKSVNQNSIYRLLSDHFADIEQEQNSGSDEYNTELWRGEDHDINEYNSGDNSKERTESVLVACERQVQIVPQRNPEPLPKETVFKKAQICFAPIISQNIRLVYLKRSLMEELLIKPETFDEKVIGSFVRVNFDPNDYKQRASHQLQLVTDVKRSQVNGCTSTRVLLKVSNRHQDIAISQLSDDNFVEEECENLDKRMKDGLLRRLTAVELEEKAKALHEDITKHWISTELARLRSLINRANEKGWRKELSEYLDRMTLLQTAAEQSRLLQKVPEVITEYAGELAHEDASKMSKTEHTITLAPTPIRQSRLLQKDPEVITEHAGELAHEDASTMVKTEHTVTLAPTPTRQRHCVLGFKSSGSVQCMNNKADFQAHKSSFSISPISGLVTSDPNCKGRNCRDSSTGDNDEISKGKMQQSERSTLQDPHQHSANAHASRDDNAIQEGSPASRRSRSPYLHEQLVTAHKSRNDFATRAESQESNHKAIKSFHKRSTGGQLLSKEETKEQSKVTTVQPLEQSAIAVGINDAITEAADYESNQDPVQSHPETSCSKLPSKQPTVSLSQTINFQAQNETVDAERKKFMKQITIPEVIISSDEEVIMLSDDDDEDSDASIARSRKKLKNTDSSQWYFRGPFGIEGGPYSISVLKNWSDTMTTGVKFKVWRANQSQEEAVDLTDAIRQFNGGK